MSIYTCVVSGSLESNSSKVRDKEIENSLNFSEYCYIDLKKFE